jgi:hypothetical protein
MASTAYHGGGSDSCSGSAKTEQLTIDDIINKIDFIFAGEMDIFSSVKFFMSKSLTKHIRASIQIDTQTCSSGY